MEMVNKTVQESSQKETQFSKPIGYSWKQNGPCVGDCVIGIVVDSKADNFLVELNRAKGPSKLKGFGDGVLGNVVEMERPTLAFLPVLTLKLSTPNKFWVETSQKRYVPCVGDSVLGIVVDSKADNFLVDIRGPALASLPVLDLEGVARRNIPKFQYVPCVENHVLGTVVDPKADNFLGDIRGPTLAFLPELALEGGTRRNIPKFQAIYQSICRPSFYVVKHTTVEEILKLRFGPNGEDPRENINHLLQTNGQAPTEPVEDTEDDEEEPEGGSEDDLAEAEVNADGLLSVYRYTAAPDRSRHLLGRVNHRGCVSDEPARELHGMVTEVLTRHDEDGGLVGHNTPALGQYIIVYYTNYLDDTVMALSCPELAIDWELFVDSVDGVIAFDDNPGELVLYLPDL